MIEGSQLWVFVGACLALVAIPGPAVIYLVTRGASEGKAVGAACAAGVALGNLFHALLAAFGLAALFASSPVAFGVFKYLGAGYLIYLGARSVAKAGATGEAVAEGQERTRSRLWQSALVGIFNPKVAVFLLAFLPQFADPARGAVWLKLLVLGLLFVLIGWAGDTCWAVASGSIAGWLKSGRRVRSRLPGYAAGGIYIALGLATGLSGLAAG